jgi:AraC-like DNA-binding protein
LLIPAACVPIGDIRDRVIRRKIFVASQPAVDRLEVDHPAFIRSGGLLYVLLIICYYARKVGAGKDGGHRERVMTRCGTHSLPTQAKAECWNDIFAALHAPMEARPVSPDHFGPEGSVLALGACRMGAVSSLPGRVHMSAGGPARARHPRYFLHLQLEGRLAVAQDGRECLLDPGDMVICDSTAPYTLDYRDPCSTLVLAIEAGELKKRIPAPAEMLGHKLSGERGLTATISIMMRSLWEQGKAGHIPAEAGVSIASTLLDLLATSCLSAGLGLRLIADSAVIVGRRLRIRRYIEANLRDPELSARSIAAAFGISPRYLHIIFAREDETVSNCVLRRRLEETAKQLIDPAWRKRTITEIAFGWGFNNATHFARVFKERTGCSPREYRARAAEPLAA